jgi:hypothetical protein
VIRVVDMRADLRSVCAGPIGVHGERVQAARNETGMSVYANVPHLRRPGGLRFSAICPWLKILPLLVRLIGRGLNCTECGVNCTVVGTASGDRPPAD